MNNVADGTDAERPRAYVQESYPWNLHHVPRRLKIGGEDVAHPGRTSAIFVVHGIGAQHWTETAAGLRSGFEDSLDEIEAWQHENPLKSAQPAAPGVIPPPFVYDGYWSNYDDLAKTFPDDWLRFNERERDFFSFLWQRRSTPLRTYFWFLRQQLRLLRPSVLEKAKWHWLLYWPLQIVSFVALTISLLRHPKVISQVLADVRLYLEPCGIVEKAVVQRIDYRVGKMFLQMLGLDWNFQPLPKAARIEASGKRIVFKRVVWVAHSLGTVVSYNVLSDLFHRAAILEHSGTRTQKAGVRRFRRALRRFVTLGSPLDKVAFLFGKHVLRPWPEVARPNLLEGGERQNAEDDSQDGEWWVNYYHVLDPVSGGLGDPLICHNTPPLNLHSSCLLFGFIPGVAHILYWVDTSRTLRFILGRTYGRRYLRDKIVKPIGPVQRWLLAAFTYIFLLALLYGAAWFAIAWAPELLREAVKSLPSLLGL